MTISRRTHTFRYKTYKVEMETADTLALEGAWSLLYKFRLGIINHSTIFILPEDAPRIERLYHEFELRRHKHELKKLHAHI